MIAIFKNYKYCILTECIVVSSFRYVNRGVVETMVSPDLKLLLIPILSGLIGWFTNFLAIKLLFWPHEGIIVPKTNFKIQGLLSRRKTEIARAVSRVISEELLSSGKLASGIDRDMAIKDIRKSVDSHVTERMDDKLRFLPNNIRRRVTEIVKQAVGRGVSTSLSQNFDSIVDNLTSSIDVANLIEQEIMSLNTREVERLSFEVAQRELKFIEYLGGILGFTIGIIQILFVWLVY